MTLDLVAEIRQTLAEHADSAKAQGMKRYMKSEMPYRGVQAPLFCRLCKDVFRRHPIQDKKDWQAAVSNLWRNASYREERYAGRWGSPGLNATSLSAPSTPDPFARR